jgi:hypothetical protein
VTRHLTLGAISPISFLTVQRKIRPATMTECGGVESLPSFQQAYSVEQKMPQVFTGGCLCGACRYEFSADQPRTGYCHCNMCKKSTGGPFAVLVQVHQNAFRWTAEAPVSYKSSPIATRGFCAARRSTFAMIMTSRSGNGWFGRSSRARAPVGHYGVESRLESADCGEDLPQQETQERF